MSRTHPHPTVAVVVPAAGTGRRMGGRSKPFLELEGQSILGWALRHFLTRTDVIEVVVAVGPESRLPSADPLDPRLRTVAGGPNRFESVARSLAALESSATLVAVHDAARPFPPPETIDACIRVAASGVGAVAGIPATDTVKETDGEGVIVGTPDRRKLWYAQTPQIFPRALLAEGVARCRDTGATPTDDAAVVELAGGTVRMVEASPTNLKVTFPADLVIARALVAAGLV